MDWFVLPAVQGTFIFKNNFMHLFVFGCAGSSLSRGLYSSCLEQELLARCLARASHCGGFSYCRAWALGARASVVEARELQTQ